MNIDLKKLARGARPVLFKEDTVLLIKPFPRVKQETKINAEGQIILSGEKQFERFKYCLEDWKKAEVDPKTGEVIKDANGHPAIAPIGFAVVDSELNEVKLTDDIKKLIFDANWEGIADFVTLQSLQMDVREAASEKN